MLHNLSIKQKNRLLLAMAGTITLLTMYLAFALTMDSVFHERENMSRRITESATSLVADKYELFKQGKLTEQEAKRQALETLRPLSYGEGGYIFVYQRDGVCVLLPPKPQLEGKSLWDLEDTNGLKLIQELSRLTANGEGGVVHYYWPRPGSDNPVEKVSYAQGFAEWDWFIGTGSYKADIYSKVVSLIGRKTELAVLALLAFTAFAFFISYLNRGTLKQILAVKSHLNTFEKGDFNSKIEVNGTDELNQMLSSMQHLQSNMCNTLTEFNKVINEARQGNLAARVPLNDKQGAYRELSTSVNELIEISEDVVGDTSRVFAAMANGQLNERIDADYQGAFGQLKNDANTTVETLCTIINKDIQSLVDAATSGDLNQRISMDDKNGFFENLSLGFNTLLDAMDQLLADLATAMQNMAEGSLNRPITNHYDGSFDQLKQDTNRTMQTMGTTIQQLLQVADFLTKGSEEIAHGSTDLARRTERQASALEATAASMEEISSMVQRNQQNAQEANDLALSARERVERGDEVVGQAITAMNDINNSSSKISEIIGVIDELAFQTNLLALNASVEAARAGEQGRGFAVVADEVRNLAGRSAHAASEIKDLIEDSVAKVEVGFNLVNQTGTTLEEIRSSVTQVEGIVTHIVDAGKEQALGIEQVNQRIIGMDETTQKNASLSEETSTAADAMRDNTQEMRDLLGVFKIDGKSAMEPGQYQKVA